MLNIENFVCPAFGALQKGGPYRRVGPTEGWANFGIFRRFKIQQELLDSVRSKNKISRNVMILAQNASIFQQF